MRVFDVHLHLPSPDEEGLAAFRSMLERRPGLIGGNLVLNTPADVAFAAARSDALPPEVVLVPYFQPGVKHPEVVRRAKWFKVHPRLQGFDAASIPGLVAALAAERPRGVMVHCFPWGPERRSDIGLDLVIASAQALPETTILATHGGGYESWEFRAHAGGLRNVHFDFSVSLQYYEGSDALRPLARYLVHSPSRVHFGSDWPSGDAEGQVREMLRWASVAGLSEGAVERLLLDNARTAWPGAFGRVTN